MEVLIIQKEVLEEMAAKFNRFTERVGALLAKLDGKSLNGWMATKRYADSSTSVREPCRRCVTTG